MPANPYDPPPIDESMMVNPYEAPRAEIGPYGLTTSDLEGLANGQRLVIYSILVYFAGLVLYVGAIVMMMSAVRDAAPGATPNVSPAALALIFGALFVFLVSFVMGFVGFFRMGAGLGIHLVFRLLLMLLTMVPLLGIVILLIMNSRATKRLRAAGYQVGFMGAKKGPGMA